VVSDAKAVVGGFTNGNFDCSDETYPRVSTKQAIAATEPYHHQPWEVCGHAVGAHFSHPRCDGHLKIQKYNLWIAAICEQFDGLAIRRLPAPSLA
jgi:hypothetical protein